MKKKEMWSIKKKAEDSLQVTALTWMNHGENHDPTIS